MSKASEYIRSVEWSEESEIDRNISALLAERDALLEALELAREELNGLPRSLGYEFTHLPKIDAAIAKAKVE